ncbi:MAG: diguanylate cyclase [Lachnospiraceae bacterium]|nr:diguanylate cyclase [Lachnospiraceae bacterium]
MEHNQKKIMEILFSNRKSVFFYWDCAQVSWQVYGDYIPKMDSEKDNPLKALMQEGLILSEDRNVFQTYLTQIEKGLHYGMPEDSLEIQCHIKSREGYQWYNVDCRFLKDEKNRIMEIAGFLEPMSAIEIMQKNQLMRLTMDRNPQVFANAIREQFARYPQEKFAFVQFDIDKFRMINELHGDEFGTEVLGNILNTLKGICNKEQLFARLSADLFLVVTRYKEEEELVEFIHYLEEHLDHYKDVHYTLAFGVYLVTDKTMETRHMGDSASLARKSIKGNALQNIAFFNKSLKGTLYSRKWE